MNLKHSTAKVFLSVFVLITGIGYSPWLFAESLSFDFATTAQENGTLTDGYVSLPLSETIGLRVDFLEDSGYDAESVDGTRFSTSFAKDVRREANIVISKTGIRLPLLRSVFAGLSWISLDESQTATWVQIDSIGEYGTDYSNDRDSTFYSPRVGFSAGGTAERSSLLLGFRYTLNLSPVYLLAMNQVMAFDTEDGGTEKFENQFTRWSAPYLNHQVELRITRYLRLLGYHSYLYLDYTTLQVAKDGFSIETVDDPVHSNTLRMSADITLPISDSVQFNAGFGYEWSYVRRDNKEVADDSSVLEERPYLRIGASVWDF